MGASAVTCKLLPHWLKPVPRFGGLNAGALSRSLRQSSSVPLDPSNRSTLEEGLIFKSSRAFSAADVQTFANVSGDHNPVHLDEDFAAQTVFKRTIVHGILTASMFSALFATHLPGSIYLSQQLKFIAPVHVGELVEATILVERLRPTHTGSMIVFCATNCATEQAGQVISGEARVLVPTS